jgi:site-specific DNA-methyltransferase (cytosine-N4-specific)
VGSEPIRLIRGDARSLPGIEPASVHLVVTSPPYPKIPQWDALFRELGATSFEAMHGILDAAWRESYRVLVDGGILAVNIGDAVRTDEEGFRLWANQARVVAGAERAGFRSLPYLLWKKPTNKPNAFLGSGFLPPNAYVTLDCEYILLLRKGGLRRFPPKDPRRAASRFDRRERDLWFSQVWDGIRGAPQVGVQGRTAAFPPEIPDRLLRMFSCVGETVLDPFCGTGTTLWAAHRRGRRAIGAEIDERLFSALETRRATIAGATTPAGNGAPSPRRRRA